MDALSSIDDLVEAARRIADLGPRYVLVKGGVEFPGDDAVDVLFDGDDAEILRAPKIGHARVAGAEDALWQRRSPPSWPRGRCPGGGAPGQGLHHRWNRRSDQR